MKRKLGVPGDGTTSSTQQNQAALKAQCAQLKCTKKLQFPYTKEVLPFHMKLKGSNGNYLISFVLLDHEKGCVLCLLFKDKARTIKQGLVIILITYCLDPLPQ